MVSLLSLRMDICMYICFERQSCCVTICFYNFGDKWLGHDNPTLFTVRVLFLEINDFIMMLLIYIFFVLTFLWKRHTLFMNSIYGIEKNTSVEKKSIMLFDIKGKKLHFENSFYCVFIVVRGMTTSRIPIARIS